MTNIGRARRVAVKARREESLHPAKVKEVVVHPEARMAREERKAASILNGELPRRVHR